MPSQVLLVESDLQASSTISQLLSKAGHTVTTFTTFEEAASSAAKARPDLLIAGVRLGRFNGLHLAARFRSDYQSMPIIILGHEGDVSLAAEAIQLGAHFVPIGTPSGRFVSFVEDLVAGRAPRHLVSTRRWQRRSTSLPIRAPGTMGWAVDIGYGGMRVECSSALDIDAPMEVNLPTVGIDVKGTFRWKKRAAAEGAWWYGFELDSHTTDTRKWRRVVDSQPTA